MSGDGQLLQRTSTLTLTRESKTCKVELAFVIVQETDGGEIIFVLRDDLPQQLR